MFGPKSKKPYERIRKDITQYLGREYEIAAISDNAIFVPNVGIFYNEDHFKSKNFGSENTPIELQQKHIMKIPESNIPEVKTSQQALKAAKEILQPIGKSKL